MSTTIIGFPRLGEFRELKFTTEKYFRKEISADELLAAAKDLRAKHTGTLSKSKASQRFLQMTSHITTIFLMQPSFSTSCLHLFKTWI